MVRLRAARGDLRQVRVVYRDRYQSPTTNRVQPMDRVGRDGLFDYYEAELKVDPPRYRSLFGLEGEEGTLWYGETGLAADPPEQGAFEVPYLFEEDQFQAPDWWRDGVIYQVMPDRFAGPPEPGDRKRPGESDGAWLGWEEPPNGTGRYPGTLRGIRDRLDHLEELGADILYLNPIFRSSAYHGYETTDYYQVDPRLGSLDDLKELVEAAHRRGNRVILDGVFNHSGPEFVAFRDLLEKGQASRYRDWYLVRRFPIKMYPEPTYETWASVARMPKLRTSHPEVQRYFAEVGLRGGDDPDNRRPMVWDRQRWDREIWETYRKAIRLRRERPALRRGRFETLWVDGVAGGYLYGRRHEGERLAIALNVGYEALEIDLALPPGWILAPRGEVPDLFGGALFSAEGGRLRGRLAPRSGAVLALP